MFIDLREENFLAAAVVFVVALAGLAARVVVGYWIPALCAAPLGRPPLSASGRFSERTARRPPDDSDDDPCSFTYGRMAALARCRAAGLDQ